MAGANANLKLKSRPESLAPTFASKVRERQTQGKSFKTRGGWKFYPQLKFTVIFPQLIEKKRSMQFLPATNFSLQEEKVNIRSACESPVFGVRWTPPESRDRTRPGRDEWWIPLGREKRLPPAAPMKSRKTGRKFVTSSSSQATSHSSLATDPFIRSPLAYAFAPSLCPANP